MDQTSDGGYIILGTVQTVNRGKDCWIAKIDSQGEILWTRTFGDIDLDLLHDVKKTSDGGYVMVGSTWTLDRWSEIWLIKIDMNGETLWMNTYGGKYSDKGYSVIQTDDGGFVLVGYTEVLETYGRHLDAIVIKTDSNGSKEWEKTFGGKQWDYAHSVIQTTDGGFAVTGLAEDIYGAIKTDAWFIRLDNNGNRRWYKFFGGSSFDRGESIIQTEDGGFVIAGNTKSFGEGGWDAWLIRVVPDDQMLGILDDEGIIPKSFVLNQNYPNPFNATTTIHYDIPQQSQVNIVIYDMLGRKVVKLENSTKEAGSHSIHWNGLDGLGNSVSAGIYLYQISAGKFVQTRKMVLLK